MHKIFLPFVGFGIYSKFYENFASTNADNETFCTVLLTSQVVLVQSLQPKSREFESTLNHFFFFFWGGGVFLPLYLIRLTSLLYMYHDL